MLTVLIKIVYFLGTALLQMAIVLLVAPLIQAIIKKVKARWQCRRGPGLLQTYYDLWKLFRKDEVVSEHASPLYLWYPWLTLGALLTASLLVPVVSTSLPLGFGGDLLLVVGLLSLVRFLTALAGLEAGSAFGGMGSSREMALASVIEPALVLGLFVLALEVKTTSLGGMALGLGSLGFGLLNAANIMTFLALLVVVVAETGRVPVDNPDTHLELTMIHEAMLLEYSGRSLGLMFLGAQVKQLLMLSLLANLFFPWGLATDWSVGAVFFSLGLYALKVGLLGVLLAAIEIAFSKMRLFKVPELMGASFILSVLALLSLVAFTA